LKKRGLWNDEIRNNIKANEGSIQTMDEIPADIKAIFRTVWEVPQKALIDMAAARGAYIDQSQSLNLFIESPTIGKLSSMYMYAWKMGVKTTYYMRSRPATKIAKVTTTRTNEEPKKAYTEQEALVCSLENPEICEACQ
jgi:ribonucleoside-diphosphate reductase alpha chain